jgi:hypothetical protein
VTCIRECIFLSGKRRVNSQQFLHCVDLLIEDKIQRKAAGIRTAAQWIDIKKAINENEKGLRVSG